LYAENLGLAFQVIDDLLDATASADELGKTPGKDADGGKRTYAELIGVEAGRELADKLTARAVAAIEPLGENARELVSMARLAARRKN